MSIIALARVVLLIRPRKAQLESQPGPDRVQARSHKSHRLEQRAPAPIRQPRLCFSR